MDSAPLLPARLPDAAPTAGLLAVPVPCVSSDQTNADVLLAFGRRRDLISLPVIEAGRPIGLISRNIFLSQMSKPYYRELYERKSCIAFMDKNPLIVDIDTPIDTLAAMAVASGDKILVDGFMIVAGGRLAGLGAGLDLMRVMVDLQTEKNRQVMQSIDYASTIQQAMLNTSRRAMDQALPDVCLAWEPRDIVGGDFYHFERYDHGWFAAVADCTGHGVPGAFLTLIASSSLNHALGRHGPQDPARLLSNVNRAMKQALGQHSATQHEGSDDGMDAAFLWFDDASRTLTWASAQMPLLVITPGDEEVRLLAGERPGLGYADTPNDAAWQAQSLELPPGTVCFCATDGLTDQIGGERQIAYGKRRLRAALWRYRQLPMPDLAHAVLADHRHYQGGHRRRDDLTFFGFRLHA